jgi:DNA-binding transcriptional regulator YdaS (Cro superfamily)
MKTQTAIEKAGSIKQLAELLGISRPAISQWGDDVPAMRVFQLKAIRPDWFINEAA